MDSGSSSTPDQNTSDLTPAELSKLAINAALSCKWEEAIRLNNEIIKEEPKNISCLNRLAHALFESGNLQESKNVYNQVLEIDPYNEIAQKNLKKVAAYKKSPNGKSTNGQATAISPDLFIAEPGTVQTVNLVKLTEPQKLLTIYPGMIVNLTTKNRGLCMTDSENNYIGALPDDISHLLIRFIKGGNKYQGIVKSVKSNAVCVLVRELSRSKKFKKQPSFLSSYAPTGISSRHIVLQDDLPSSDHMDEAEELTD